MDTPEHVEHFSSQPNVLLNLSQAAVTLGYKDYRIIETLIEKGHLKAYKMPHAKRLKVRYHEVMKLPQKLGISNQD
tara:strand:+ start:779 stop:1006 length:228 start_codon:yes stop_codon:yes gene_type:complete